MRIKATALLLSALLPLTVSAMPEQGQQQSMQNQTAQQGQKNMQKQSAGKQQKSSQWNRDRMQQWQTAWFDRLDLTPEQRQQFKQEMSQHHAAQMKSRAAHHDKLRALLTDEQRVIFDQDVAKREQRMQRYMQSENPSKRSPMQRNNAQ